MPKDQMPWKVCAKDVSGSAVEAELGASPRSIVIAVEGEDEETRDDGSAGSPQMHRVEMMRDDFKRWSKAVLAMSPE